MGTWLDPSFSAPARLQLATTHHLRQIREDDVDLDYPAVMGSRERLWRIFGPAWGWPPATMTKQADRDDVRRQKPPFIGVDLSWQEWLALPGPT